MITQPAHQAIRPRRAQAVARLSRRTAVLVAISVGLLGSVTAAPAAFAGTVSGPGRHVGPGPLAPPAATAIRGISAGGLAGVQAASLVLVTVLIAAAVAVRLARAQREPQRVLADELRRAGR